MLNRLIALFKPKTRRIAFLDGDQNLTELMAAYKYYLAGIETHLVRCHTAEQPEPRALRNEHGFSKCYLIGYTAGKEITDKFIAAYIQRAISEGYNDITVVSNDYDFIDIFKMAVQLNPNASQINFRLITPSPLGRVKQLPAQLVNIEVIKIEKPLQKQVKEPILPSDPNYE